MAVILWGIFSVLLIAADQYTKYLAVTYLSSGNTVDFIPGVLDFVYVENRGAAFGMLQDTRWFLIVITVLALIFVAVYAFTRKKRGPLLMSAVALIFAGGFGNMIDRVVNGYVVDFIHTLFIRFPCFNVADICVTVGGVLLICYLLFFSSPKKEADDEHDNHDR